MDNSSDLHTPLYDLLREYGGRFVNFAGWQMPVQFTGIIAEHQAVRNAVGIFDVSHMGELLVEGPDAFKALDFVVTNSIGRMQDGKALYTLMCLPTGGIVDDIIIYREAADRYFICANASRKDVDFAHLRQATAKFRCKIFDCSNEYAQLALQGPKAAALLTKLSKLDVKSLSNFTFCDATVANIDSVRVARTGYTGEDGFELYCAPKDAVELFSAILKVGADYGLMLCGLGARDTLRLEMKYSLYGNDIDTECNPIEAGLEWAVKLNKGDFIGREALIVETQEKPKRKLIGFKMVGRGIPRHGYDINFNGEKVGVVTSGTHSPTLNVPIGIGYVPTSVAAIGTNIDIIIRDREVSAVIVETPFYQRAKHDYS
ncbi:MAG: glycine cleavage system aminomethyltransferase GcvT [Deltaproteobacteria bacterium]|nr:glycine cleavage system aminomethyltransferase GcvT [Deltaproteobacteria bacterium]